MEFNIDSRWNTLTSGHSVLWLHKPSHFHMETPYVLISNIQIHNTYADTFCKMTQAADNCNTHTYTHTDTCTACTHKHTRTQFSWCNDPFGIEQHLFSKWRLVVGMLVIFSLTQWANRGGQILFSTYTLSYAYPVPVQCCHVSLSSHSPLSSLSA